jgi:hypothetical protein
LTSKRAEISECIRLLEARPGGQRGRAIKGLIERLRLKAEWLDKRIQLELRQTDSIKTSEVLEFPRPNNAA